MQTIKTNSGKTYTVNWCGASTVDYALRFEIVGSDYTDVFLTFIEPEETKKLIHSFDGHETVYYNYTGLNGITAKVDNTFVIALNPKVLDDINKEDTEPEHSEEEIQNGLEAIELLNILFGNET